MTLTIEDRAKLYNTLSNSCHYFVLNMNDTFSFACADAESISVDDFDAMSRVVLKYGHDALNAYVSIKRNENPIVCK
jgi:uncharacterized phage-associated protein